MRTPWSRLGLLDRDQVSTTFIRARLQQAEAM
jgi:hypothetical protein